MASEEELAKHKAAQPAATPVARAALASGPPAEKLWHAVHFNTVGEAIQYAMVPPAQVAGEFGMVIDPAGGVYGYYFF